MTPRNQQIEDRMVEAVLTAHTCGEGCWYAKEKTCRCSCGGKNHGCLLVDGVEKPARTSRIDGDMYELAEIGTYQALYRAAADALKDAVKDTTRGGYKFYWSATEAGSPVRLKKASKAQCGAWTELSGMPHAYLVWKKLGGK